MIMEKWCLFSQIFNKPNIELKTMPKPQVSYYRRRNLDNIVQPFYCSVMINDQSIFCLYSQTLFNIRIVRSINHTTTYYFTLKWISVLRKCYSFYFNNVSLGDNLKRIIKQKGEMPLLRRCRCQGNTFISFISLELRLYL